ncbi:hypothetical protein ABW22_03780 [Thiobacillus denitrificans]|uniref:Uncharacterized protein n=1 Tax=Thiobacillus denitrificans TaxID=36861 RepID=A0A125BD87_THIDE|nr:hypothetical protein ABW22_03780 [Thiobacillus denitrificans]
MVMLQHWMTRCAIFRAGWRGAQLRGICGVGGRQSATSKSDCGHIGVVAWAWKTAGRGGTKARVLIAGWPPHLQDRSDEQREPCPSSSWQQSCAAVAVVSTLVATSAIGQQAVVGITPASTCAGRASAIRKARSTRSERMSKSVRGRLVLSRQVCWPAGVGS